MTKTWTYDSLQRLTSEAVVSSISGNSYSDTYTLDLVGNRLSKTDVAGSQTLVATDVYNANDQLTSETGTLNGSSSYQVAYGYDTNGSLTSVSRTGTNAETDTYTYDLQHRLATATISRTEQGQSVSISASYTYDDAGYRAAGAVTTTVGGGSPTTTTTQYLTDRNNPTHFSQVLEEHTNGSATPSTSYVPGLSVLAQTNGSGSTSWLMPDVEISTRLLADGSGNIAARYAYDAYGNLLYTSLGVLSPPATKVLYTGQQFDPTLLQYYLRARYYNPPTGRFTQLDPFSGNIKAPQTLHKYLYAGDNPVLYSDPSGQQWSLSGVLVNLGITYALNALLLAIVQPAAYYIARALLPPEYVEYFRNFNFSALMVGAAFSAYGGFGGAVGGSTVGGEILWSLRTANWAGYFYGGPLLGAIGATSGAGLTLKFGSVFALPDSVGYTGPFVNVTVSMNGLPRELTSRMAKILEYMAKVGVAVLQRITNSPGDTFGFFGQYPQLRLDELVKKLGPTMQRVLEQIQSLNITVFWDEINMKPLGFDVEYNPIKKGEGTGALTLTLTDYTVPSKIVPF